MIGCDVTNSLAQQNRTVTIVEMLETIGVDMEQYTLNVLLGEFQDKDVNILTSVQIREFTDDGIVIIDKGGNRTLHKADTVVLALGVTSSNGLAEELEGRVEEIYTIGDARQPRSIREAISEGFMTAYSL